MKTLIGLLFTLFAIQAAGYNFYISNYKVYSSSEEAYFTYYNYYHRRNDMPDKTAKFVLYRVSDNKDFFTSGSLFRYGNLLSDSLMETLTVVKQWDHSISRNYSSQESLGKLPEGVYILEGIHGSEMAQIPIIISDYSLIVRNTGEKAVTYMSNRETGEMVKGYKSYAFINNQNIEPLYYKNATAIFDLSEMGNNYYYNIPMVTVKGNKVAVSQSYFYNYYYNQGDPDQVGYIFTDRSAYRPEQVIKFKGVFRVKDGFGYKVQTDSIVYGIYNEQHEEVARKKVGLDKSGAFNDSVEIDKSWKLGEYTITYNPGNHNNYYYWYGNQNSKDCKFRIEEYKKPEFEVGVTLDKSQYSTGDHIKASIAADYFFGAPVTNATVSYKVVAEPFYIPWYYNYRYYWWYEDLYGSQYYYGGQQVVHQGTGTLNKEGKLEVDYQTDEKKHENYRYTVIAEVTDASRRAISGSSDAIVAYTSFTLSANTQKYYYETNEGIRLEISTLDYSRNRVDESVRVKLYRYTYDHHTWRRGREVLVTDTTVSTHTDMATIFDLPKQEPGHYNVVLEAEDSRGHRISQAVSAYVIDPGNKNYYWWTAGNYGSIRIMTDKKVYNAGETVNAIIYVPHSTDALITVNNKEFAHFDSYHLVGDKNGAFRTISVPIDRDAYGRMEIFVAYNHNNQYYSYKEDISIIPDNKYLNVDIQFDANEYQPGNTATALVRVTDHKGRPVANADVTLSTADEAIYSLYPDLNKDISRVFYNTEVQNYQYNYQNQYSVSASSRRMPIRGIEWRRKKLSMNFDKASYLGQNQWYYYAYQTSISKDPVVRGYVVDYKSGEPLRNAVVEIGKHRFRANANGYYELRGFKMSHTTISFVHNGRKTTVTNLPMQMRNDVDLVVAVSEKEDKEIVMSADPTITAIDDVNRVLESTEVALMEDAVAAESVDSFDGSGMTANYSVASGGAKRSLAKSEAAPPPTSKDMEADELSNIPVKEKSKDKALVDPPKTRSDFQDAIYWNPKLKTDAQGYVKISIKLPDNLTTWRTSAKVITNRTEVGQTMAKTIVTKNLLVRMETPRFMTLGDELLIATTVHNYLSSDKEVTVELQANGLAIEGTRKTLNVAANDDKSIDWKVNTKYITEDAKLTVKALTDEESDAMEITLPVQPYGLEMVAGNSLYLANNNTKSMVFTIPDGVNMHTASLELSTAPSVTAALLSSMDDLIGYPYGCVEQTMSRFLPTVIVAQTIEDLGKDYVSTIDKAELKKMVAQGVKRLGELQHNDGGWGWWENDKTNAFMTAYVVNGLYMGQNAGYEVPEDMLNKGKQALAGIIRNKSYDTPTAQAYDMMVAAKVGLKDLWKYASAPENGNSYEYALWLQAAHYANDREMAARLIPKLEEQAIKAGTSVQWGGKKFYYSWQDDQVETTANAILALSLTDEDNAYIPGAVSWIMSQRKGNSWHNTRQTAMTIFGLSRIIKNDANPDLDLEIYANGVLIDKVHYTSADVFNKGKSYTLKPAMLLASMDPGKQEKLALLNPSKNEIRVVQKGKGSLFVNGKLIYFLDGNSGDIKAEQKNMSFDVERTYYKLVSKEKNGIHKYYKEKIDLDNVHSGDNILVKVKIHARSAHEYVLIEDPIPAGCEFIRDPKGYVIDGESIYDGSGNYWNYRHWGYWNWNRWYSHREYRDSKISHTITNLSTGDYEYSYLMKAQIPGNYKVNPCIAQLMYYPENRGFSTFETFRIME